MVGNTSVFPGITMTIAWREWVPEPSEPACAESQPVPVRSGVWLCTLGKVFPSVGLWRLMG